MAGRDRQPPGLPGSVGVIVFMPAMAGFFVRFFVRHIRQEDEGRRRRGRGN